MNFVVLCQLIEAKIRQIYADFSKFISVNLPNQRHQSANIHKPAKLA